MNIFKKNYIDLKLFCTTREANKVQKKPRDCETILVNNTFDNWTGI